MTSRTVTLAGYVILALAAVLIEARARTSGRATFGDAVSAALRPWPGRLLILAGWLWLGWHTFVRGSYQ